MEVCWWSHRRRSFLIIPWMINCVFQEVVDSKILQSYEHTPRKISITLFQVQQICSFCCEIWSILNTNCDLLYNWYFFVNHTGSPHRFIPQRQLYPTNYLLSFGIWFFYRIFNIPSVRVQVKNLIIVKKQQITFNCICVRHVPQIHSSDAQFFCVFGKAFCVCPRLFSFICLFIPEHWCSCLLDIFFNSLILDFRLIKRFSFERYIYSLYKCAHSADDANGEWGNQDIYKSMGTSSLPLRQLCVYSSLNRIKC